MLAKASLLNREQAKVVDSSAELSDFFAAFGHQPTEEQKPKAEDIVIEIDIWETNLDIFDIYRLLQNYLGEYYQLDTNILLQLINSRKLDLEETLLLLPYIHATYVTKISPKKGTSDGE